MDVIMFESVRRNGNQKKRRSKQAGKERSFSDNENMRYTLRILQNVRFITGIQMDADANEHDPEGIMIISPDFQFL